MATQYRLINLVPNVLRLILKPARSGRGREKLVHIDETPLGLVVDVDTSEMNAPTYAEWAELWHE
jgi:hypothetical protein